MVVMTAAHDLLCILKEGLKKKVAKTANPFPLPSSAHSATVSTLTTFRGFCPFQRGNTPNCRMANRTLPTNQKETAAFLSTQIISDDLEEGEAGWLTEKRFLMHYETV